MITMVEILDSSVLGNVVGIVSLIISVLTLRKTRLVSTQIKKLKTKTILKMRFEDFRPGALEDLETKCKAIKNTNYISQNMLYELLQLVRTINDLATLAPKSKKVVSDTLDFIKAIMNTHSSSNEENLTQLFDYLAQIINILKKGE